VEEVEAEYYSPSFVQTETSDKVSLLSLPFPLDSNSETDAFLSFPPANYSTAKAAILGLTRTLAIEGESHGIRVNCIAPSAGTAMTKTVSESVSGLSLPSHVTREGKATDLSTFFKTTQVWPQEMVDAFKPDFVAPLVGYLASEDCETSGELFEVSGGWAAQVRWERSGGVSLLSLLSILLLASERADPSKVC